MKIQQKLLAAAALVASVAPTLQAQPYYARGSFNDWGTTHEMADDGDGTYSVTAQGLTPGSVYEFKIALADWSAGWPANNAKVTADTNGDITFHFRSEATLDGWNPVAPRVGYSDPGHGWEVMGSFNGWTTPVVTLTNKGTGLYEGAYPVPAAGTYQFKFRKTDDWNIQYGADQFNGGGDLQVTTTEPNQVVPFRLDLPNGRWLAGDPMPPATNKITFLVDMAIPIAEYPASSGFDTNTDVLYVRGPFNNWATDPNYRLYQVGGTLFSNTIEVVAYQGSTIQYKFFGDAFPGEETPLLTCNAARELTIESTEVTAPLTYWNDRSPSDPTNHITFQVDMTFQEALGTFTPGANDVYLRGSFNNWSTPILLTNKPAPETNIYVGVLELPNWPIGSCVRYKFFNNNPSAPNSGWETISDRQMTITSPDQILAVASFNDLNPCTVLDETNYVTFTVSLTNAVATDATVYDGTQGIYLNGAFLGWWGWGAGNPDYLMTLVPGSSNYSITLPLPAGTTIRLEYKYSMNAADNEASFEQNHVRYIRTEPGQTSYTLPLDLWTGTDAQRIANLREPEFGNLTATLGNPGEVDLRWLGLKCVAVQSATDLTGPWTTHTATDGMSQTNMAAGETQMFFRLIKPGQ